MTIPFVTAAPAHAATTVSEEGSAVLESFPSTKHVLVNKFDDDGGLKTLTEVTVTATVEGELEGSAENLSDSVPKTLNGTISAEITVGGIGVSGLVAAGDSATSWNLAPGETQPISIAASDDSETTISDPEVLEDFVGAGQLDYTVESNIEVKVDGPAPYKTTGVAGGEATVKIDYTYDNTCELNPEDPVCAPPECETSALVIPADDIAEQGYVLPGGGTFTIVDLYDTADGPEFDWTSTAEVEFITVQTASVLTTVTEAVGGLLGGLGLHAGYNVESDQWDPITGLTVCAAAGEGEPDPDCDTEGVTITKIAPVKNAEEEIFDLPGGGEFSMTGLSESNPTGEEFDWTSTVPVFEIQVKGGPGFEEFDYPGGAMAGSGLHAPYQPSQDAWHGVNYILVCSGPGEPTCEDDPEMEGCDPPTCEEAPDQDGCEPDGCIEEDGFKIDPVTAGIHILPGGGIFTILNKEDLGQGEIFDWISTVAIGEISVKGGPVDFADEAKYVYPPNTFAGQDLHSPFNENSGKWYGLSHITLCDIGTPPDPCEIVPQLCNPCEIVPQLCDPCVINPASCEPVVCEGNWFKVQDGNNDADSNGVFPIPGGTITISNLEDVGNGEIFDWASSIPIYGLSVKGGPVDFANEQKYDYPGGATSGQDVHAPFNGNSGKWYGLSHFSVCLGDGPVGPAGVQAEEPKKEEPKGTQEQPPAKVDQVPAPKDEEEAAPEPEPEPEPEPATEPEPAPEPEAVDPPADPAPAVAAEPEPTPEPAAGDTPAGE